MTVTISTKEKTYRTDTITADSLDEICTALSEHVKTLKRGGWVIGGSFRIVNTTAHVSTQSGRYACDIEVYRISP